MRYRVLCLSRNLTFNRSWDTILAFDGKLTDRTRAIGESKPLAEFVEALPQLAIAPLRPSQRSIVDQLSEELRRVRFAVPEPFETMRLLAAWARWTRPDPLGEARIERMLVVSPFLAASRLRSLASQGKKHVLVSRIDQLAAIPKDALYAYSEVHVLHDAAVDIDDEPKR